MAMQSYKTNALIEKIQLIVTKTKTIYKNGNYNVILNLDNGTKIRETEDDEFKAAFAENMDIKISNYCDMDCKFCHEGSTKSGKHGDILNEKFIGTLHPYQEVALGGGDATSHPDLIPFLQKLKDRPNPFGIYLLYIPYLLPH